MSIKAVQLNKSFGKHQVITDVSFEIESGELVALLGPSGGGKSTILRILAGLERPDSGEVFVDGECATNIPVEHREIGFVFQHYALFRHLTVAQNVSFGLEVRKVDKNRIASRTAELLELVGLEAYGGRYPAQLSGGQRQRVALARALAPEPKLLLLDEPFGAIDSKVREELREWLRRLHDQAGVTSILVTHDQEEAFSVADRVLLINKGHLEQDGTPADVYHRPSTAFAAGFIGTTNRLPGRIRNSQLQIGPLLVPARDAAFAAGAVEVVVRAEELFLRRDLPAVATVTRVISLGYRQRAYLELDDVGPVVAEFHSGRDGETLPEGTRVGLELGAFHLFESKNPSQSASSNNLSNPSLSSIKVDTASLSGA